MFRNTGGNRREGAGCVSDLGDTRIHATVLMCRKLALGTFLEDFRNSEVYQQLSVPSDIFVERPT